MSKCTKCGNNRADNPPSGQLCGRCAYSANGLKANNLPDMGKRSRVAELRQKNLSYREIGNILNISRERARQLYEQ